LVQKKSAKHTVRRKTGMLTLNFDEFLRSLKMNMDSPHSLLLGAGASIESGIPSAVDCIWDWKREIFLSQNMALIEAYNNIKVDSVRTTIQKWLDGKNVYPKHGADNEYSFYAEKAFLIDDDRRRYFQNLVKGKKPSLGYHLICMLSEVGLFKSVWTTNFDGLVAKCANQYNINPIEITLDTTDRVFRGEVPGELLCISLHGDYKYGPIKNTTIELDSQNETFVKALIYELTNRDLIVMGYSGRDESLMNALSLAYQSKGSGKLFWCGYGLNAPDSVTTLIEHINNSGRTAFYISTDGFDKTFYSISRHCMSDNKEYLQRIDDLKRNLGITISACQNKFDTPSLPLNKISDTNVFPVTFPSNCYQLELVFNHDEKPWDYCKMLGDNSIMAVPHNGFIYAWGENAQIQKICSGKIKGNFSLAPITRETFIYKSAFRELLLRTITSLIGISNSLSCSKDRIWDTNQKISTNIGTKSIVGYKGIRVALFFDKKYSYITLTPDYVFDRNITLSHEEKKQFADYFNQKINDGKPNLNIYNYVKSWVDRLLGKAGLSRSWPINSATGFNFRIIPLSAILGINNGGKMTISPPQTISNRRIVLNGIECRDPELVFYNKMQKRMTTDFHPMRGLSMNAPFDYSLNERISMDSIKLGVICPSNHVKQLSNFLGQLNCKQPVDYNIDYVIPFPGFFDAFKTGLSIPTPESNLWIDLISSGTPDIYKSSLEFGKSICHKLDQLSATSADVAIIYIPKEFEPLTGYSEGDEKYDLHDYVKAYAAQKSIATQFVREKTLDSSMYCQIKWALSLAIYVKSSRIPWVVSGIQTDTAFAGIGYSVNHTANGTKVIIGCSHIYSSDGQGMKYKLSKIDDVTFDRKNNPYLSEDESYRLGLNIRELFYKSFTELPKRVVIHKRTPFRKDEIKGLTESLTGAGIHDIDLLEITYEDNLKCFELTHNMNGADGFPVHRGLYFSQNDNTMYLYTHGIAPSVRNPNFKYIQGGKTIPLPLKIVKHYGSGSISQIATEVLGLSKMNWNSFGLYSKLPCTIETSNEIARIGWLLSQYEGALYDYRYFM
jgi:hypothetical protein